jgi:hypothetical protein
LVYIVLLSVGKTVLKMTESLWENSLIIAKYVGIIRANYIITEVTFSQTKWRHYFRTTRRIMRAEGIRILYSLIKHSET